MASAIPVGITTCMPKSPKKKLRTKAIGPKKKNTSPTQPMAVKRCRNIMKFHPFSLMGNSTLIKSLFAVLYSNIAGKPLQPCRGNTKYLLSDFPTFNRLHCVDRQDQTSTHYRSYQDRPN